MRPIQQAFWYENLIKYLKRRFLKRKRTIKNISHFKHTQNKQDLHISVYKLLERLHKNNPVILTFKIYRINYLVPFRDVGHIHKVFMIQK